MQLYQKETLENGLRLVTAAMPHTRSVSIGFFVGAGSRYESDDVAGISHFIEHLCFKGTPKRAAAKDIASAIEGVGGMLNGGTDKELTIHWSKVASIHFPLALDVLEISCLIPSSMPMRLRGRGRLSLMKYTW